MGIDNISLGLCSTVSCVIFVLGDAVPPLVNKNTQQRLLGEVRVLVHHPVHGAVGAPRLEQPRVTLHPTHGNVAHCSAHEWQFKLGAAQVKCLVPEAATDERK